MVRNGDLADIMQRRRFEDQLDILRRQLGGKARMPAQVFAQHEHVVLRTPDMIASLVVPGFNERAERGDRCALSGDDLLRTAHELV